MIRLSSCAIRPVWQLLCMLCTLCLDATRFLRLCLRSPAPIAAENLFLCKQLALYQERNLKPQRASNTTRFTLVWLSQWFDWPPALAVVHPETFGAARCGWSASPHTHTPSSCVMVGCGPSHGDERHDKPRRRC